MAETKIWYVFYTRSRSEKILNRNLLERGYETFLPLVKTIRVWSDRKKKVEVPLIPSYIFVKIKEEECYNVLKTPNIVKIIKIDNKPVPVPEKDINNLKTMISGGGKITVSNIILKKGDEIEITHGQFKGFKGVILRKKGKSNLIVFISALKTTFSLEISLSNITKITNN